MMQVIKPVFPKYRLQRCTVHQVRSSTRYVSYKNVTADLKKIYNTVTLEEAETCGPLRRPDAGSTAPV